MLKIKNKSILIFYVIIFYLIYVMSLNYPVHTDEYMYSYIFGTNIKITEPIQLLASLKRMYLGWSGRIISNFLQQFFIYIGGDSFAILNALLLVLILYFSSKIILNLLNKVEEYETYDFLIINILVFYSFFFSRFYLDGGKCKLCVATVIEYNFIVLLFKIK